MPRVALYRRVADLHIAGINQGFLSTLGPGFLAQMYRAIDEGDGSVLFVTREGDEIVGFVAGSCGMEPIYRRMLRRWPKLLVALAPALLSPSRLWRILEIMRYSRGNQQDGTLPKPELLSIAVDSAFRGKGHADRLYQDLCAHFKREGLPAFKIIVGAPLAPAHRFYRRMGAEAVGTIEVHGGEPSVVYVHRL